jgi:hypothetical protein
MICHIGASEQKPPIFTIHPGKMNSLKGKVSIMTAAVVVSFLAILSLQRGSIIRLNKRGQNFIRVYKTSPRMSKSFYLKESGYYFAGIKDGIIFLGNYRVKNEIVLLNQDLTEQRSIFLNCPTDTLFARRNIIIQADSDKIWAIDLDKSDVYAGQKDRVALQTFARKSSEFVFDAVIVGNNLFTKPFDTVSQQCIIKKSDIRGREICQNKQILQKQLDGVLSLDGQLLYDKQVNKFFYIYFYRDQIICFDTSLSLIYRKNTIDTTSYADIHMKHVIKGNYTSLSSPPLFVNKSSFVAGPWIYICSTMIAKNDLKNEVADQSIIDVYEVKNGSYKASFRIPDFNGNKISAFLAFKSGLVLLQGGYISTYTLPTF